MAPPARPRWTLEALDVLERRAALLRLVVGAVIVVGALAAVLAPGVVPPRAVVGVAVAVAALLLGVAVVIAVDAGDAILRGPRHVRAAGGELVGVLPETPAPDAADDLAAAVLDARPGRRLTLGLAGAQPGSPTAAWSQALATALARRGASVLVVDLASGASPHDGILEVLRDDRPLARAVELDPELKLARIGAGRDLDAALQAAVRLPDRLPRDLEVLLVALPPIAAGDVLAAATALDTVLVVAASDRTRRARLQAALEAVEAGGTAAQVVLVDERAATAGGHGPASPAATGSDDATWSAAEGRGSAARSRASAARSMPPAASSAAPAAAAAAPSAGAPAVPHPAPSEPSSPGERPATSDRRPSGTPRPVGPEAPPRRGPARPAIGGPGAATPAIGPQADPSATPPTSGRGWAVRAEPTPAPEDAETPASEDALEDAETPAPEGAEPPVPGPRSSDRSGDDVATQGATAADGASPDAEHPEAASADATPPATAPSDGPPAAAGPAHPAPSDGRPEPVDGDAPPPRGEPVVEMPPPVDLGASPRPSVRLVRDVAPSPRRPLRPPVAPQWPDRPGEAPSGRATVDREPTRDEADDEPADPSLDGSPSATEAEPPLDPEPSGRDATAPEDGEAVLSPRDPDHVREVARAAALGSLAAAAGEAADPAIDDDAGPEAATPEDVAAEAEVAEDAVAEDAVAEDAVAEEVVPEAEAPEDVVPDEAPQPFEGVDTARIETDTTGELPRPLRGEEQDDPLRTTAQLALLLDELEERDASSS